MQCPVARKIKAGVVEVNTTNSYTLAGPGKITGNCSLQKDGAGALIVSMANDFTGGAILNAGTDSITTPAALGTSYIRALNTGVDRAHNVIISRTVENRRVRDVGENRLFV